MRRPVGDGFELDDDPERVDLDAVATFLRTTYWASGRPEEAIAASIRGSHRVVGLYHDGRQAGFARVVSDGETVAYLADVYVLPEHRGRGLGRVLTQEAVEGAGLGRVKWMLHTRDAHGLYASMGFGPAGERFMERPPEGGWGDGPG